MRKSRNHGVTLIELIVVVSILGVVALVAIPDFTSSNPQTHDAAAEEFASAMRFARSEALRLGSPHGFQQQSSQKRIRVFRLDTTSSPWVPIYDIHHPLSKQLYDIGLDTHPFAAAGSVSRSQTFIGSCNVNGSIYFDSNGIPRCADPETVLLEQFDVTLTFGTHSRVVTLHGITGRVTVQ